MPHAHPCHHHATQHTHTAAAQRTNEPTNIIKAREKPPSVYDDDGGKAMSMNSSISSSSSSGGDQNLTVRLLIPAPAAGIMIGRQGIAIKNMSEVSVIFASSLSSPCLFFLA